MAKLQTVKELVSRGRSEGMDKVAADLNKVADAQDNVARAGESASRVTDTVAKKQISAATAYRRLLMSVDETFRSQQKLASGQGILDRALEQGKISADEYARALDLLKNKHIPATVVPPAMNDNIKLAGYEVQNLSFQLNDMATMLLSGASPFQVLATQGGQVYQILSSREGGLSAGVKGLGGLIAGLITPTRLVVGGLAGLGVAAAMAVSDWAARQKQFDIALTGAGRSTDATAGKLEQLATAGAAAARVNVSSAREITATFAATGKIGTDLYVGLISASKRYVEATGTDIAEVGKDLAGAFADPAKGALELDQKLNFLSQSTLDYIRNLASSNQKGEAQRVLLRELTNNLPEATARLTLLGRAWRDVASFASSAYSGMGRALGALFVNPALDQQIVELQKQLRDQEAAAGGSSGRASGSAAANADATRAELKKLQDQQAAARNKAQAATDQQNWKDTVGAARAADPRFAELDSLNKQISTTTAYLEKQKAATAGFDAIWGGYSEDVQQVEKHLSGLKNQYDELTDSTGKLKPVAEAMRKERELEIAVTTAATEAERKRAQAALDGYRAKKSGASTDVVTATVADSEARSQAEIDARIAQAQRDRVQGSKEVVSAQQLEIMLIGKTAGETAVLRANYQAFVDLQREAARTGQPFDAAKYEAIKQQNEALREQVELYARISLRDQVQFDIDQLGRSKVDQTIASAQRSAGISVDLNSTEAGLIRLRETLSDFKDASSDALGGFVSDVRNGVGATEALGNAVDRLADRLTDMVMDQALSGLFGKQGLGGLLNTGGSGGLGSIFSSLFGGGSGGSLSMVTGGAGPLAVPTFGSHSGGIGAAEASFVAMDNPALYRGAPRYHGGKDPFGLLPGERRAIIKDDEGVFTAQQMRALGAGGRGQAVQVNNPPMQVVFNGAPEGTRTQMADDGNGGQRMEVFFDEANAANMGRVGSKSAKTLNAAFGVRRRGARR